MVERISRNDHCPCGSGKKFKRCCRTFGASQGFSFQSLSGRRNEFYAERLPSLLTRNTATTHSSLPQLTGWNEVIFDAQLKGGGRLHVVMLYSDLGLKLTPFAVGDLLTLDLSCIKYSGPAMVVNIRPSTETASVEGHVLRVVQFRNEGDLGKPLHGDWQPSPEAIARWQSQRRHIVLKLDKPDGSWCDIKLLRTIDWIKEVGARVGKMLFLDLAEVGTRGWAKVLEIKPCGIPDIGSGEMVTGTFRHSHGRIGELVVESESEPLGVTPGHLIWSVDRQDWVPAGKLRQGETLKTEKGITRVISYTQTDTVEPVYNIEVENDHCYRVGESGILVHNASLDPNYIYSTCVENYQAQGKAYQRQKNEDECVPACVYMILQDRGIRVAGGFAKVIADLGTLQKMLNPGLTGGGIILPTAANYFNTQFRAAGLNIQAMSPINTTLAAVEQSVNAGYSAIVGVEGTTPVVFQHAFIIDGIVQIKGVKHYQIRDPEDFHPSTFAMPEDAFLKIWNQSKLGKQVGEALTFSVLLLPPGGP